jgi:phosphate uptake regulator
VPPGVGPWWASADFLEHIPSILLALSTLIVALKGLRVANLAKKASDSATVAALITTDTVNQIHAAVNSERTAMMERLENMHAQVLEMTKQLTEKR